MDSLPLEMLESVFKHLPHNDRIPFRLLNKRTKGMIDKLNIHFSPLEMSIYCATDSEKQRYISVITPRQVLNFDVTGAEPKPMIPDHDYHEIQFSQFQKFAESNFSARDRELFASLRKSSGIYQLQIENLALLFTWLLGNGRKIETLYVKDIGFAMKTVLVNMLMSGLVNVEKLEVEPGCGVLKGITKGGQLPKSVKTVTDKTELIERIFNQQPNLPLDKQTVRIKSAEVDCSPESFKRWFNQRRTKERRHQRRHML